MILMNKMVLQMFTGIDPYEFGKILAISIAALLIGMAIIYFIVVRRRE